MLSEGRVLLTGATGFIGRHALRPLAERGFEVHAVVPESEEDGAIRPGVRIHRCDLHDRDRQRRILRDARPTHLLHLAWHVPHGSFWTSPENLRWVGTSLELFRSFAEAGGRRIVGAGTCAEYGTAPQTLYGACKEAVGRILLVHAADAGVSAAWGRIFDLYGPHEDRRRIVPSVIRSLLAGEPAGCAHPGQVRDLLHVADVASALAAVLDSELQGAIDIGSGAPVSLGEVVDRIAVKLRACHLVRNGADLPFFEAGQECPPTIVADADPLRTRVGWKPEHTLDSGLDQTIDWWRHEGPHGPVPEVSGAAHIG